jgi:hypothetical protein
MTNKPVVIAKRAMKLTFFPGLVFDEIMMPAIIQTFRGRKQGILHSIGNEFPVIKRYRKAQG